MQLSGAFKIWFDVVLCSIPYTKNLSKPAKYGYFEDVEGLFDDEETKSANNNLKDNSEDDTEMKLMPKPRFGGNSEITIERVENSDKSSGTYTSSKNALGDVPRTGGTYSPSDSWELVQDVYDASNSKLMSYNGNKALLVYLDDDGSRGAYDRTVLRYMLFDGENEDRPWSAPQNNNVWVNNDTADFDPFLLDAGDKILVAWSSRPNTIARDFTYKDLLMNMEVYTTFFDKATGTFVDDDGDGNADITRMTNDKYYDYYPKAIYDNEEDAIHLYYLKASVSEVNSAEELLDNVQPEVSGAYLMYMTYADIGDGRGKRWLTDYYYDFELPNTLPAEERQAFINEWKGQRFKNLSTDVGSGGVNSPNINDYDLSYAEVFDATDVMDEINDIKEMVEHDDPLATQSIIDFAERNRDKYKKYNITCYVVEGDGNAETKDDTDLYLKLQCADELNTRTVRLTNNNVSDTNPKMVRTATTSYLFWIQNESMIKMTNLNDIIYRALDEDHASNDLPASNINIVTTDKLFLGDKISNFTPFADDRNNIYLAWKQNSEYGQKVDEKGEITFVQDLLIAGLVRSKDENGNQVNTWSNPLYVARNYGVNDSPTFTMIGRKLLSVHNRYNLKSAGESYKISDSKLMSILYTPTSSIEPINVDAQVLTVNDDGSIRYKYEAEVQNVGLYTAEGYDYIAEVIYAPYSDDGGKVIAMKTGESSEYLFPGSSTMIEGEFTLSKEQQKNKDDGTEIVSLKTQFVEKNVGDYDPSESNAVEIGIFKINEEFAIVRNDEMADRNDNIYNYGLHTQQQNDKFVIKGILKNTGTIPTRGNEKIYVYLDGEDKSVAESDYFDLPIDGQMDFEIPISYDLLPVENKGIQDLWVVVKTDYGAELSHAEGVILKIEHPYNFKVNGEKDTIRLKVGEKITLNTTYEPSERFVGANISYMIADRNIARHDGNTLYGVKPGETVMQVSTDEFGGREEIKIIVEKKDNDKEWNGGNGGGGSGGSGAGPALPSDQVVRTTETNLVKNPTVIDAKTSSIIWVYNPTTNTFKLNATVNGQVVPVANGFYTISDVIEQEVNGVKVAVPISDTYFFDQSGNMITGWLKTSDGKWYFFENLKTIDEGKMAIGWRKIENVWYYFAEDGSMLRNTMTPDGQYVDNNGAWIAPVITASAN